MTQRITRSNSLKDITSDNTTQKELKVRKASVLSPELNIKESKKSKQDMALEETLKKITDELASIKQNVNNIPSMDKKIDSISNDIANFRKEVDDVKAQINIIKENQADWAIKIENSSTQLNIADQMKLDEQIMITDVPSHITKDNFIMHINDWSKNLLKTIGYKRIVITKTKKLSIAFIHFWHFKDKFQFMQFVKTQQKINDEYVPILNEQVFQLKDDDVNRASILHFQTPMTKLNQDIFKEARTYKKDKKIEGCWLMEGSIFIKRFGQTKGIRIDSIEHLRCILNSNDKNPAQPATSEMDVNDS